MYKHSMAQVARGLYNALPLLADYLNVMDLVKMSFSSKSMSTEVRTLLKENASLAVCIASHRVDSLTNADLRALEWLYAVAGRETVLAAALECKNGSALLAIPNVSKQVVHNLVKEGYKISYGQLLAASIYNVEGVEAWMLAHRKLCKPTWGHCYCHCMPSLREAIACGYEAAASRLLPDLLQTIESNPNELTQLLYIAVNQHDTASALALLAFFQHMKDFAVFPQNTVSFVSDPVLNKAAPLTVLQQLVTTCIARKHVMVIHRLAGLASARQVGVDTLTAWIDAAMQQGDDYIVCRLLQGFSAANKLPSPYVSRLLDWAIQMQLQPPSSSNGISASSPAQQGTAEHGDGSSSLQESVHLGKLEFIEVVCKLPGCQRLPQAMRDSALRSSIGALLKDAVNTKNAVMVKYLCMRPAAALLDTQSMRDILVEAVSAGSAQAVESLCDLPAAQQVARQDAAEVARPLWHTLQGGCSISIQNTLQRLWTASAKAAAVTSFPVAVGAEVELSLLSSGDDDILEFEMTDDDENVVEQQDEALQVQQVQGLDAQQADGGAAASEQLHDVAVDAVDAIIDVEDDDDLGWDWMENAADA